MAGHLDIYPYALGEFQERHVPMFSYSDRIMWCNEAAAAFLEKEGEEIVGRKFDDFAPAIQPDGQSFSAKIDYALNAAIQNHLSIIRLQFFSSSRQYKYAEVSVVCLPEKFLLVFHDVTRYVERENELHHRINRLERAIATGSDTVFHLDLNIRTFYFFPSLLHLLGYKTNRSSITMDGFLDLVHEDDKGLVRDVFAEFDGADFQERFSELRLVCASGEYLWFWFRGTLETLGIDGKPLIISGTATNVQEKKESEKHLRTLNEELRMSNEELMLATERAEESDRLKTSFLENLSHELRTPMNGIIGFSDLLKDDDLTDDDRNAYIDIIRNSAKQLLGIVSDLVEISKIDTGQIAVRMNNVNLFTVLYETYKIMQKQAESNPDIVLDFISSPSCRDIVLCSDEVKLKQIFTNLIGNAIKYTARGYVRVRLNKEKECMVISVEDSGCGIKSENIPLVFRRFVRLKNNGNVSSTGAGLGLSIAKGYVELLGGTIEVESEYGKGSKFTVRIPIV